VELFKEKSARELSYRGDKLKLKRARAERKRADARRKRTGEREKRDERLMALLVEQAG